MAYPQTWFFFTVALICVITQLNYLNKVSMVLSLLAVVLFSGWIYIVLGNQISTYCAYYKYLAYEKLNIRYFKSKLITCFPLERAWMLLLFLSKSSS